jgi:uncharacterized protein YnzC (UPF0291/DUF896 family)
MKLLLEIYNVSIDSADLEEAVAALAWARSIVNEFTSLQIPVPEKLKFRIEELEREVKLKRRDYLEAKRRSVMLKLETLKTRDQRAADAKAELEQIEAQLK